MEKLKPYIINEIKTLKSRALEKIKQNIDTNLDKPVASWIKKTRLIYSIGYEFTIILKTCGCKWANSESGGCSMCGYFIDKGPNNISQNAIQNQFKFAINKHAKDLEELSEKNEKIALKIFTSGSFLDESEISQNTLINICEDISNLNYINEFVIESRPEFIETEKIRLIKKILKNKILEVGIGLESANNYIREVIINKGFNLQSIKNSIDILHKENARVKAYLLFKPPFINERIAIEDLIKSINECIKINVDTISINPIVIQRYTIQESLFNRNQFRPPWFYSLFEAFQRSLDKNKISKTLILCSPMAIGTEKGIHNCLNKDCNNRWINILEEFINSQNINLIQNEKLPYEKCKCWAEYNLMNENI